MPYKIYKTYWLAMQGLAVSTFNLLILILIITFIFTLFDDIIENKKGGDSMKKIIHIKLNAKMLAKAIVKNTLVICKSVIAKALSANAF
jgi:hypothetical protein